MSSLISVNTFSSSYVPATVAQAVANYAHNGAFSENLKALNVEAQGNNLRFVVRGHELTIPATPESVAAVIDAVALASKASDKNLLSSLAALTCGFTQVRAFNKFFGLSADSNAATNKVLEEAQHSRMSYFYTIQAESLDSDIEALKEKLHNFLECQRNYFELASQNLNSDLEPDTSILTVEQSLKYNAFCSSLELREFRKTLLGKGLLPQQADNLLKVFDNAILINSVFQLANTSKALVVSLPTGKKLADFEGFEVIKFKDKDISILVDAETGNMLRLVIVKPLV